MNKHTTSVRLRSTYSQNAYPFDRPVALSFTRLKARNSPNELKSSFTCKNDIFVESESA